MEASLPPAPQSPQPQRGRFSLPMTLRIPISAGLCDRAQHVSNEFVSGVKEAVSCLCLLFVEPIMDTSSLLDLSIGLLLLERVGSSLQPYETTLLTTTEKMIYSESTNLQGNTLTSEQLELLQRHDQAFHSFAGPAFAFLGSPFCLFLSLAAMFIVVANSSSNSAIFAPLWFRILTHQSTTFVMYILIVLFVLESVLVVCILVLACHALLFPQYLEENMSILFVLSGLWTASLMASSLVRYNLHQSIGD
jgi:hypothetical protein